MIKKMIAAFLLTGALSGMAVTSGEAEEGTVYRVGADSLNIRSAPYSEAPVIGSLSDKTNVIVETVQNGWARIQFNGKQGWIASQFLYSPSAHNSLAEAADETGKITVKGTDVRLRTGPGTEYRIIGTAGTGKTYSVISTAKGWFQLNTGDGQSAWMSGQYAGTEQNSHLQKAGLAGRTFIIDAGHGGRDPGATAVNGRHEKDFTLKASLALADLLRREGAEIILTRNGDRDVSLEERSAISRRSSADAFISLHYDAFGSSLASGISTYYYDRDSRQLASAIGDTLTAYSGLPGKGTHFGDFHVLRENDKRGVLIELGFLTSMGDMSAIEAPAYNQKAASAIVEGLKKAY
ncbi:N-acetylmuramoyl-L-alanine amidase [Peribacillus sp. SCS-37]|uniref:N-acetylmuramoyl-L-alanine amidase n=1 Tax=Paraperibacillus esterisolvens TaxID=3115296 RepID=UPI003905C65C